jgi:hypothetical protein
MENGYMHVNYKTTITLATPENIEDIYQLEKQTWGARAACKKNITRRIQLFPKGNFVAYYNNNLIGYISGFRCFQSHLLNNKSWNAITNNGKIENAHDEKGDLFFGVTLTVAPNCQHTLAAKLLTDAIANYVICNNIKAAYLGARVPHYYKHTHMSIADYVHAKNHKQHALDPELRLYLKFGLTVESIIAHYFEDPDSLDYGILMKWKNPLYNSTEKKAGSLIGMAQKIQEAHIKNYSSSSSEAAANCCLSATISKPLA